MYTCIIRNFELPSFWAPLHLLPLWRYNFLEVLKRGFYRAHTISLRQSVGKAIYCVARVCRCRFLRSEKGVQMSNICFRRMAFRFAIPLFITASVFAQSDIGSIGGFVKDPSGGVIPKAKVVVKNEATGQQIPATTNESGYYVVTNLQPGNYTVPAESQGFKRFESSHNTLVANGALSLDPILTVGAATETVEVTATAAELQTESSAVQSEVTGKQVLDQELNGRNPIYMAQML